MNTNPSHENNNYAQINSLSYRIIDSNDPDD